MPDDETMRPMELVALDMREAAFALQRALARKRHGHAKSMLDSTLHLVVSEMLADALTDAGYILAVPKWPDPTDRRPLRDFGSTPLKD